MRLLTSPTLTRDTLNNPYVKYVELGTYVEHISNVCDGLRRTMELNERSSNLHYKVYN